ncbi:MAG: hypothetical protein IKT33_03535 [Clostridia bacterium]|nr:hypothetical protein [Clostridia bacterium]
MPSMRGSSGGARSFGGSHFSRGVSRSFGGSHFNRNTSSSSFGGSSRGAHYRPSLRWRPHTTVIFGRPVYFGAGRAKASSILSLLLVIGIIVSIAMGCMWVSANEDLQYIQDLYPHYADMIESAETNSRYQTEATVVWYEEYGDSGKYCFYYDFCGDSSADGFSFCHYSYEEVVALLDTEIIIALNTINTSVDEYTDSVPMMDKDYLLAADMSNDMEYVDVAAARDGWKFGTLLAGGVTGLLIVASVIVSMTAQKATKEQIEETEKLKNGTSEADETKSAEITNNNQNQTWRCNYCGSLNDTAKHSCDGCGAGRQK